ncbi:MAG TPA: excisionase family DNA-binding protein [Candidatus Dormibacteraeota bacterium]|nr:excisionase family DNA-binding protein [Candidatus Dormibacteraeota bacterium]
MSTQEVMRTESLLLRVGEVAQLLNLGRTRTFELIASGELPVVRIGRAVRVPRNELDAMGAVANDRRLYRRD